MQQPPDTDDPRSILQLARGDARTNRASPWVRPLVWAVALVVMALPLLSSGSAWRQRNRTSEIERVIASQEQAWNDGNLEEFLTHFAQHDGVSFVSGESVSQGFGAVAERYRERYPDAAAMGELSLTVVDVEFLGRAFAQVVGRWQLTGEDGSTPEGLFTLILKRDPDGWKVIHDHTSSIAEP